MTTSDLLRQQAQALWEASAPDLGLQDPQALVHELQVHQIELELQNQELLSTQVALAQSRALYFDLYDLAPVGYCTVAMEGGLIQQANLTLATLLGLGRGDVIKKKLSRFISPEDQDVFYQLGNRLRADRQAQTCELRMLKRDGSPFWVQLDAADPNADSGVMRVTIADITARKQEQANRLINDAAFSAISQGVIITGADLLIVSVNAAFLAITGYSEAETLGRNCRFIQGPGTDSETVAAMRAALQQRTAFAGEILNYRKDGTPFWNELTISPVWDAQARLTHFVGVTRDISDRKKAQDALQASLREKVALLKEVHHRVNNNLQVITSLLRLEAHRTMAPESVSVLKTMQGRVRTMAQLHQSLYRSGTFASVDLGAYLGQIATHAFHAHVLDTCPLQLKLSMGSVRVGMDQAIACGLLVNELVVNCLKHGFPDGSTGEVRVALQPTGGSDEAGAALWQLQVSDNGVGLPSNFEAKRKESLGLHLATDLGKQLGGTLTITSEPGAGAAFSVVFQALKPVALVMP